MHISRSTTSNSRRGRRGRSIGIAPMPNGKDVDESVLGIDGVKHSIVPHAKTEGDTGSERELRFLERYDGDDSRLKLPVPC